MGVGAGWGLSSDAERAKGAAGRGAWLPAVAAGALWPARALRGVRMLGKAPIPPSGRAYCLVCLVGAKDVPL